MLRMKKAFTLLEILIVVIIVGVLSTIAIPSFRRSRLNIKSKQGIAALKTFDSAYAVKLSEDKIAYQCGGSTGAECNEVFDLELLKSDDWSFSTYTYSTNTYEDRRVALAGTNPNSSSFTAIGLLATNNQESSWQYRSATPGSFDCIGDAKYCNLNKGLYE